MKCFSTFEGAFLVNGISMFFMLFHVLPYDVLFAWLVSLTYFLVRVFRCQLVNCSAQSFKRNLSQHGSNGLFKAMSVWDIKAAVIFVFFLLLLLFYVFYVSHNQKQHLPAGGGAWVFSESFKKKTSIPVVKLSSDDEIIFHEVASSCSFSVSLHLIRENQMSDIVHNSLTSLFLNLADVDA